MPRTIYNEGRVVGLSSHEIYVKEALSEYPDMEPATEREWLSSSLGSGASLVYKLPADTNHADTDEWVHQVELPGDSRLCAANTIVASWFDGEADVGVDNWANKITSYGDLIVNDKSLTGKSSENSKYDDKSSWSENKKSQLRGFLQILDGVVIQPGKWEGTGSVPVNDFSPDLSQKPFIRLRIRGKIEAPLYILFTGFSIRTVLAGTSGLDGSTATYRPDDGDFLGPAIYPWANKIVFSIPPSYIAQFEIGKYIRTIDVERSDTTVDDTPIIDMKSTNFQAAFANHLDSTVDTDVSEFSTLGEGGAVLTVYAKHSQYLPALWATYVTKNGDNKLYPVDIVAPGTVKMFKNGSEAELKSYEECYPGTFGVSRNVNGTLSTLDSKNKLNPIAQVSHKDIKDTSLNVIGKAVVIKAGDNTEVALSMGKGGTDTIYNIHPNPQVDEKNFIYIRDLIKALSDDRGIDLLGERLRGAKQSLTKSNTNGSTAPYLEFGDGDKIRRLYISSVEPTGSDIPDGSIGIGWNFN